MLLYGICDEIIKQVHFADQPMKATFTIRCTRVSSCGLRRLSPCRRVKHVSAVVNSAQRVAVYVCMHVCGVAVTLNFICRDFCLFFFLLL